MKNELIIALEEVRLIEAELMTEDEVLHTYEGWKARGYIVKKGEKAIAKFPIWKNLTYKDKETGEKTDKIIMKVAAWFSTRQVTPIADKADKEATMVA